jgi:hypothetical protein
MLNVVKLTVIITNVLLLNDLMLNVVMLSDVMPSVIATMLSYKTVKFDFRKILDSSSMTFPLMDPGANVIKLFTAINYKFLHYAREFVRIDWTNTLTYYKNP